MNRNSLVIDTSAIIAQIKREPGAEKVRLILHESSTGLYMHAINVCEVAYHLIKFGIQTSVAFDLATPNGVIIIDDVRPGIWKRAAVLKASHQYLALGDCIAISLAESLDANVLTGDRDFQKVKTNIMIKLFR